MRTNLTSELQLTDSLLTDQLTKRCRNLPLMTEAHHMCYPLLTLHVLIFSSLYLTLANN